MRKLSLVLPLALLAVAACSRATNAPSGSTSSSSNTMTSSAALGVAPWDGTILKGKHTVVLKTVKGDITLELDADAAPKTVTNFITLAKAGFYNGLTFHRVIDGFMIQGGDPNGNGTGGGSIYGPTFADEITPSAALYKVGYKAGVIAMANRGPNTNGSQFFIMQKDYPLPPNYTIFGHVTSGLAAVDAIAKVPADPSNNLPKQPVTFTVEVKN